VGNPASRRKPEVYLLDHAGCTCFSQKGPIEVKREEKVFEEAAQMENSTPVTHIKLIITLSF